MNEKYSTPQKIAFAGVTLGFLLCAVGGISPYWQTGTININSILGFFGESLPGLGNLKLVSYFGGLYFFCIDIDIAEEFGGSRERDCYRYEEDDNNVNGQIWICRLACVVCVLCSLACTLAAMCRQCCCSGGKTICHGIMTFIAGSAGILCAVVFGNTFDDGVLRDLTGIGYGWAFYLFCAGSGILVIVSFMLCFSSPGVSGMIYQYAPGTHSVPYNQMTGLHVVQTNPAYSVQRDGTTTVITS